MPIEVGDILPDGDGWEITIVCTDLMGDYPVGGVARKGSKASLEEYTKGGRHSDTGASCHDLILPPDPITLEAGQVWERLGVWWVLRSDSGIQMITKQGTKINITPDIEHNQNGWRRVFPAVEEGT